MKGMILRRICACLLGSALAFSSAWVYPAPTEVLADTVEGENISYDVQYRQTEARKLFSEINSFRTSKDVWYWSQGNAVRETPTDLKAFTYDYGLEKAAMIRAAEIAAYYSYDRPNGESFLTAYSYGYTDAGECIASGFETAEEVLNYFRADAGNYSKQADRRNLLERKFSYIAVGHVVNNGVHFWAVEFNAIGSNAGETAPDDTTKTIKTYMKSAYSGGGKMVFPPDVLIRVSEGMAVDLRNTSVIMNPGERGILINKDIHWIVADTTIADVNGGLVYTKKVGGTVVTAYTTLFGKDVSASVNITVISKEQADQESAANNANANEAGTGSDKNDTQVAASALKKGDSFTLDGAVYKVVNDETLTVMLQKYQGDSIEFSVPSKVECQGASYRVIKIADKAFALNDELLKVVVSNSVTQIGAKAFAECGNLSLVTIGTGVKSIGANAFSGCEALSKLTVKSGKLTKKGVSSSLKNSSVNTIKLSGSAAVKKLSVYKKYFVKSNSGRSVTVKK